MHFREWSESQHKAASLLAMGASSTEVGVECNLSSSQIKYLKKLPEFVKLVQEIKSNIKKFAIEETRNAISNDIRNFRRDYKQAANNLQEISTILLEKLKISAEAINPKDITVKHVPTYLKVCGEAFTVAMTAKERCLSLDKVMELSDELQKNLEHRGLANASTESVNQGHDIENQE